MAFIQFSHDLSPFVLAQVGPARNFVEGAETTLA